MATASSDGASDLRPSRKLEDKKLFYIWSKTHADENLPFVVIANFHEIKAYVEDSADVRNLSCFLLPDPGMDQAANYLAVHGGGIEGFPKYKMGRVDGEQFRKFWHYLDDMHKERRVLLDYMALLRDIDEPDVMEMFGCKNDRLGFGPVLSALEDIVTEVVSIYRRLFIEEQHKSGKDGFPGILDRMLSAVVDRNREESDQFVYQWLVKPILSIYNRMNDGVRDERRVGNIMSVIVWYCHAFVHQIFERFVLMFYFLKFLKTNKERRRYLKKLKIAEVHWRDEDRAVLLEAIETKGASRQGTYIERLIQTVGLEKFEVSSAAVLLS